jgi:hypothetical protein
MPKKIGLHKLVSKLCYCRILCSFLRLVPLAGGSGRPPGKTCQWDRAVWVAPAWTGRHRMHWSWTRRYRPHYRSPLEPVSSSALSTPDWSVWIQIDRLNMNLVVWIQIWWFLIIWGQKIWKKSKKLNFMPHSPINTVWGPKNSKTILKNQT